MQQINNVIVNIQNHSNVTNASVDLQIRAYSASLLQEMQVIQGQSQAHNRMLVQEGQRMSIMRDEVAQAQNLYELTVHNEVRMRAQHMLQSEYTENIGLHLAENIQRSELQVQHLLHANEQKDYMLQCWQRGHDNYVSEAAGRETAINERHQAL